MSRNQKKSPTESVNHIERIKVVCVLIFGLLAVLSALGLLGKAGAIGAWITVGSFKTFGLMGYLMPVILAYLGWWLFHDRNDELGWRLPVGTLLTVVGATSFLHLLAPFKRMGGALGILLGEPVRTALDIYLGGIATFGLTIIGLLLLPYGAWLVRSIAEGLGWVIFHIAELFSTIVARGNRADNTTEEDISHSDPVQPQTTNQAMSTTISIDRESIRHTSTESPEKTRTAVESPVVKIASTYVPPPLSLLESRSGKPNIGDVKENSRVIQNTLKNFGIDVEMDEISTGPSITRYAVRPAQGLKLSRILQLRNELSLTLAVHPIRIEAPIPGKSLVGIEIPNRAIVSVGLGELLGGSDFQNAQKPLTVALGKGVSGKSYFADISKMPHLLIAGATGSGKSVTAHNLILSLLYRNGPDMVRLILVDPKRVELTLYNNLPHLLTPVIKDAKRAIIALRWATREMERRYNVLESHKVRDIDSYHNTIVAPIYKKMKPGDPVPDGAPERMPYIVILIDELADIMQAYPRELESGIVRLAQMSRAVGIHLVLSTQRPSVNVITGLIKANIPARMALKVSSQIDSRTILDASGAETLLGRGDMLFKGGEMSKPERIQCALATEDEVKSVVARILRDNRDWAPDLIDFGEIREEGSVVSESFDGNDSGDDDSLYEEAREIVLKTKIASTSYIQRKLRVGYSRAARLIDLLEERGVIGPANGSKPREILLTGTTTETNISQYDPDETPEE